MESFILKPYQEPTGHHKVQLALQTNKQTNEQKTDCTRNNAERIWDVNIMQLNRPEGHKPHCVKVNIHEQQECGWLLAWLG